MAGGGGEGDEEREEAELDEDGQNALATSASTASDRCRRTNLDEIKWESKPTKTEPKVSRGPTSSRNGA